MIETASTWKRVIAFSIDEFFRFLCVFPVWIQLIGSLLRHQQIVLDLNWIFVGILFRFFYDWLFLYFIGGTLGKVLMGLRVVPARHPDQGLGLLQSFLRVLTDSLSFFFGHALRALALLRLDRTHVSDWVAETRVVQFSPRKISIRRHFILALVIVLFSGSSQFLQIYKVFQRARYSDGSVIVSIGRSEF